MTTLDNAATARAFLEERYAQVEMRLAEIAGTLTQLYHQRERIVSQWLAYSHTEMGLLSGCAAKGCFSCARGVTLPMYAVPIAGWAVCAPGRCQRCLDVSKVSLAVHDLRDEQATLLGEQSDIIVTVCYGDAATVVRTASRYTNR